MPGGVTSRDYYRSGNSTSPMMDNVRSTDVVMFSLNGVKWVQGESGGISVFDAGKARAGKNWWRLNSGTLIPNDLDLYR